MTNPTPTTRNRAMTVSYSRRMAGSRAQFNHTVRGMRAAHVTAARESARPDAGRAVIADHSGTVRAVYTAGRIDRAAMAAIAAAAE